MATASTSTRLTMARRKELKDLFDAWDQNGDGYVDEKEFREVMLAAGKEPDDQAIEEIMGAVDQDNDRKMNFKEFVEVYSFEPTDDSSDEEEEDDELNDDDLKEIFNTYDKDKSGTITISEIKEVLKDQWNDTVEKQLKKIDDGDGLITFEEFKKLASSCTEEEQQTKKK